MSNEEENGKGRVLDLDAISGKGRTLNEIIESGEEIPDELRESLEALGVTVTMRLGESLARATQDTVTSATQVLETYGGALQPPDWISLYEMMRIPETVAEVPQEEAWRVLAESNRKEAGILERLLDDQRKGRKTDRVWAAIGWGITVTLSVFGWLMAVAIGIVGWVIAVVLWWLSR